MENFSHPTNRICAFFHANNKLKPTLPPLVPCKSPGVTHDSASRIRESHSCGRRRRARLGSRGAPSHPSRPASFRSRLYVEDDGARGNAPVVLVASRFGTARDRRRDLGDLLCLLFLVHLRLAAGVSRSGVFTRTGSIGGSDHGAANELHASAHPQRQLAG